MALSIILNGTERTLDALSSAATVADLVAELGVKPDRIAVEHNGAIVSRKSWPDRPVQSGDRVEIVHFVGGGSR